MKLISLSCAWIAGIYLASLFIMPLYVYIPAITLPLFVILLLHRRRTILRGGLLLIILLGGIGFYGWRTSEVTLPSYLEYYNEQHIIEIRGTVAEDPQFEENFARLTLSAEEIETDNVWREVSGKLLVYVPNYPCYNQGDFLKVQGEFLPLSQIKNPGFRSYLIEQGYCAIIYYPEIEYIQTGWLFNIRNDLAESLEAALPEPQASLSQALLLGLRSHIPDSLNDSFRSSGTAHVLAISGLHVAILAGIVLSIAAWIFGRRRPTYILMTFILIWIYALLSGLHPPAFRAAIMFSLFLTALWLGRPRSILPSLALTAAIIVSLDPQALRDISFQLSFAAVTGIIFLYPAFQRLGRKATGIKEEPTVTTVNPVVDSLAVTLAAIVATFPLIAYYFGYVSLTALPATLLIMLAMPGAIILTLITALLGLFAPTLASIAGWVDWLFLSYIIEVAEFFGGSEVAKRELQISAIMVLIYYVIFIAIMYRRRLTAVLSRLKYS